MSPGIKARGHGRILKVDIHTVEISLPWWMVLLRKRKDRAGRDRPTAVAFPTDSVSRIRWREPRWWSAGKVVLTAPGYANPWRKASWWPGRGDQHPIRYGLRRAEQFEDALLTVHTVQSQIR